LAEPKGRVDGVSLVQQPDGQRLFILGKPGAGKTTFLKHLAYFPHLSNRIESKVEPLWSGCMPSDKHMMKV
jgi:predicted NACHT family NTPase